MAKTPLAPSLRDADATNPSLLRPRGTTLTTNCFSWCGALIITNILSSRPLVDIYTARRVFHMLILLILEVRNCRQDFPHYPTPAGHRKLRLCSAATRYVARTNFISLLLSSSMATKEWLSLIILSLSLIDIVHALLTISNLDIIIIIIFVSLSLAIVVEHS